MRTATITGSMINAWEIWHIDILDDEIKDDEITPEWLSANTDKWEYFDLDDRGDDGFDWNTVEVYGVTG